MSWISLAGIVVLPFLPLVDSLALLFAMSSEQKETEERDCGGVRDLTSFSQGFRLKEEEQRQI